MNLNNQQKLFIYVILVIVGGALTFKFTPVLLDMVGLRNSDIFVYIGILIVLILPIANSLRSLRYLRDRLDDDIAEDAEFKYEITDWIPFLNDWKYMNLYNEGNILTMVVSVINKVTAILVPVYLLYLNLGVVFVDLGVTVTMFILNTLPYVIILYVATKIFSVIHMLMNLGASGVISVIVGVTTLFGYMYIPYSVKVYMERQLGLNYDKRLGEDYTY